MDEILTFEISLVAGKQTFSYSCNTAKKSSKHHHLYTCIYRRCAYDNSLLTES